jgi:hypothetical protein
MASAHRVVVVEINSSTASKKGHSHCFRTWPATVYITFNVLKLNVE